MMNPMKAIKATMVGLALLPTINEQYVIAPQKRADYGKLTMEEYEEKWHDKHYWREVSD